MNTSIGKSINLGMTALICSMTSLAPLQVEAFPNLQLYIEGGTYDSGTETWSHTVGSDSLRLWVIGNTAGPGSKGDLLDVNLVVSIDPAPLSAAPNLTLTGTTTGGFEGFFDPSVASNPVFVTSDTGEHPVLSPHGIFDGSQYWEQFDLGDMTLVDSPVADFINEMPSPSAEALGQINVYDVAIPELSIGGILHFDAFGYYTNKNGLKETFAPYSHDAISATSTAVPEPGSFALLGTILCTTLGTRRTRRIA